MCGLLFWTLSTKTVRSRYQRSHKSHCIDIEKKGFIENRSVYFLQKERSYPSADTPKTIIFELKNRRKKACIPKHDELCAIAKQ